MIVVTAPTSRIGRQLLTHLLPDADADADGGTDRGAVGRADGGGTAIRVIARRPDALPTLVRERAEVVVGSHGEPDVVAKAFVGADTVFWLAPPVLTAATLEDAYLEFTRPAAAAIRDSGVRRVVTVSALGRGTPVADRAGLVTASLAMEDMIAATGVAQRALALPTFMDNWLRQITAIRDQGVIASTANGDLRSPTCATGDIAARAADLLREDTWTGQGSVAVLGPQDLTGHELADIMSDVFGRPIRYQRISVQEQYDGLVGAGWSAAMARGLVEMMTAKNDGLDNGEPRTPASTSPTTFRRWCEQVLRPAVLG
ncbi:NAD(P)H-binding protein [Frankia sp. Ag45/Mut15]|uniref:NAD(P)H-binding protein n=1 Tax=Frankia umida TaxID=573489 RepID=A0ABT0JYV3_9ACTN|nr:NAD(P)H-binding protein [Frankia umida]MCK9876681.1 NAD(P)H-binding protein [Frankia umida]